MIPAAGRGVRLGESVPKAFVQLAGTPMLHVAVEGLLAAGGIGLVVLVVPAEHLTQVRAEFQGRAQVVAGGAQRTDSVRAGLLCALESAPEAEYVLVHDAARALTPPWLIRDVLSALRSGAPAVVPAVPIADTVKSVDTAGVVTGTPDRDRLRAVQTPQGFTVKVLRAAHTHPGPSVGASDDAGLVERMGTAVHTIAGDPLAFKITTPLDLLLAQAVLQR